MKKLLVALLGMALFAQASFATVSTHPTYRTYSVSISEALSKTKQTANLTGTLIVIINYDLKNTIAAHYSVYAPCDTAINPSIGPRTSGIISGDSGSPNHICLYDAASGANFWNGDVNPTAIISVYVSNGTYVVYNTPIEG